MAETKVKIMGLAHNVYSRVSFEKRPGRREKVSLLEGKEKSTFHGPPPLRKGVDYINVGEEDQMEIYGFIEDRFRKVLTWIAIVGSLFVLRLVFHWKPEWMLRCTHVRSSLEKAKKILLVNHYRQFDVEIVNFICVGNEKLDPKDLRVQIFNAIVERNMKLSLPRSDGSFQEVDNVRFFENRSCLYIWDVDLCEFYKLHGFDRVSCSYFYLQKGLAAEEQTRRRAVFGTNSILVPVQSIIKLLFLEVLNPFYVFQVFSVCLWYAEGYNYYASCIVLMSAFSVGTTVVQTRTNQKALRNTVQSSDVVTVWRGGSNYEIIPSESLVPGDVIVVPSHGCMMYCDAVLISGNCIVNESMLTGESVPVTKTPVPNSAVMCSQHDEPYNPKEHGKHTLFSGTKVIQTRYYGSEKVKAVVIRTGFMTCKGELVRSIMYPKPLDFKFQQDSYRFIGLLFGVAIIGFIYTVILKTLNGTPPGDIALDALDLITIVVPPALPAAMTVGIAYAQARLRKHNIYCISPRAINISGCVNCVCFDKTGTLTEDGLDMWGAVPTLNKQFQSPVTNMELLQSGQFLIGMASCHSLTIIDGQLCGDPLDLKMFEATNWILEEPEIEETTKFDIITPTVVKPRFQKPQSDNILQMNQQNLEIGIVRQFTFSSSLQRMSVVTRVLGAHHFEIYTKGSPEMIASLCNPDTVPDNFTNVLMTYTQSGYRVLALATKPLLKVTYAKVQRISRQQVECSLNFLGLLVMENRLKPETTPIIQVMQKANVRTIMVTGDNMLTALSVAHDCGMIEKNQHVILVNATRKAEAKSHTVQFSYAEMPDKEVEEVGYISKPDTSVVIEDRDKKFHFAITGKSFGIIRDYFPELVPKLVVRGTVFARMSPDQKKQLVEHLQELGYYVGMCGDGANDCGALKAAHAGLSLSEAEASVASPFTSKEPNISCVPILIREGRAALITSFGIFKYMACYSFTQFVSVMILYSIESNLTDMQFLYIDLFIITLLAAAFGRTEPYPALVRKQPPSSLISVTPIVSITLQMLVMIGVQIFAFMFSQRQPWYSPHMPRGTDDFACYENYSVFAVSVFQYITLAVVFAKGAPYRKTLFTNHFFLCSLIALTAFTGYLVVYPNEWLANLMELKVAPVIEYRLLMVGIAAANFVVCLICESVIIGHVLFRLLHKQCRFMQPVYQYMHIEQEIQNSPEWPPVSKDVNIDLSPPGCETVPNGVVLNDDDGDSASKSEERRGSKHSSPGIPFYVSLSSPWTQGASRSSQTSNDSISPIIYANRNVRKNHFLKQRSFSEGDSSCRAEEFVPATRLNILNVTPELHCSSSTTGRPTSSSRSSRSSVSREPQTPHFLEPIGSSVDLSSSPSDIPLATISSSSGTTEHDATKPVEPSASNEHQNETELALHM